MRKSVGEIIGEWENTGADGRERVKVEMELNMVPCHYCVNAIVTELLNGYCYWDIISFSLAGASFTHNLCDIGNDTTTGYYSLMPLIYSNR